MQKVEKSAQDVLKALLSTEQDVRKKVFMKRFGVDFEIKALLPEEANKITERATRLKPKGEKVLDEQLFNYLTIVKACVVPNWEDPKLLDALGAFDAVEAIKKKLLFGEVAQLLQEIAELNGFDQTDDEQVDEIKN